MKIKKVTLISNNICYGPEPKQQTEVEQKLTILKNGRVWFTGYNYNGGFKNYKIGRKIQLSIGKKSAALIFEKINEFLRNGNADVFVTDMGYWEMTILDEDEQIYKFKGSLCGDIMGNNTNSTNFIRKSIPIDNLFVFEGSNK